VTSEGLTLTNLKS